MGRACNTYGEKRNSYRILALKLKGKRPIARPRRRYDVHITIYFRKTR
jgi:hypothetical protein